MGVALAKRAMYICIMKTTRHTPTGDDKMKTTTHTTTENTMTECEVCGEEYGGDFVADYLTRVYVERDDRLTHVCRGKCEARLEEVLDEREESWVWGQG